MIRTWAGLATVAILAINLSCSKGTQEAGTTGEKDEAKSAGAAYQPTGNEGTVTGKVTFAGQAPKYKPISMDADSVCAAKHSGAVYPDAVVVNSNGTLRNVFVYVKSGLEGKTFPAPQSDVELDQDGCIYKPHVLGIMAGQNLKVVSSDATTHNIHPMPKVNREWNVSQAPGADPIVRNFSRAEASIPVKCNQHPWMRAYIHVMSSPYFAVSGADGSFTIAGLPPGDYELEAVQEEYGATIQKVTVGPKESKSVDFAFRAGQAYRPSSLTIMPAIMLGCCGGAN